ncbi:MAG TPA: hydrogenase small subunit [Gammaproteobacteria bacterium]|jgi:hydrogenase small subunit|nr:hydrogenase small subunit [Gammaproteobacteria bacterium]
MNRRPTVAEQLAKRGVSRRAFLKFCAAAASLMALPPSMAPAIAEALGKRTRPSVIWLSFQECTGCTESLTRSHTPTIESLIFDMISLDYHHTLQAASGTAAEHAREQAMAEPGYLVLVDGSIPTKDGGIYSTIAGMTNLQMLKETLENAAAVVTIGTCAAYGGIPKADPNPTGAKSVQALMDEGLVPRKPVINVPGCPPIPTVITGVLAHYLTFGEIPELDHLGRPTMYFGDSIHDRCYRRPFYDQGKFAKTFDDEGARKGWCLFELGCKGPTTYNACATAKWNNGTSFPIESGHGCIGCSEPDFWDAGSFYSALSMPTKPLDLAAGAVVAGVAIGAGVAFANRSKKSSAKAAHKATGLADLEK